jgi:tRNA (guanine-N1)-methyltransferase
MINYYILTLFPKMIMEGLNTSIIGRAVENELLSIAAVDIRDYSTNKHKKVDDYPYGGGAGMVMQAEPIYLAYEAIREKSNRLTRVIYLTPQGKVFDQNMAKDFAKEEELVFLCGHYEGIDERVLEEIVTDYVSIGDYVLTGGELPAMVMVDAIARLVPGVLNNEDSTEYESFENNLLEHPHYSRPVTWKERNVPDVLLSGHHKNIEVWRKEQSLLRTLERRPELLEKAILSEEDKKFLGKVENK